MQDKRNSDSKKVINQWFCGHMMVVKAVFQECRLDVGAVLTSAYTQALAFVFDPASTAGSPGDPDLCGQQPFPLRKG